MRQRRADKHTDRQAIRDRHQKITRQRGGGTENRETDRQTGRQTEDEGGKREEEGRKEKKKKTCPQVGLKVRDMFILA